jgi:glycosyltransferase involved in cell wall biosynthesis
MKSKAQVNIGVDISAVFNRKNGIGRYTYELLISILQSSDAKTIKWYFYSTKKMDTSIFLENKNIVFRFPKINLPRFCSPFFYQFFFPIFFAVDELDTFWSPTHKLPFFLPTSIFAVITIHDLVWLKVPLSMKKTNFLLESILMPYAIKRSNQIIAVSQNTKKDLISSYNFLNNITVIYPSSFKFRNRSRDAEKIFLSDAHIKKKFILFVGTLEPRKNLERLIRAFLALDKKLRQNIDLVIVGAEGWGGGNFFKTLKSYESDSVKFLGQVDDKGLDILYSNALFLAFPSLYEGFGLPIVESMKRGCPVLTSNISSMPEVLGLGGILVNPTSEDSITEGLLKLIVNRDFLIRKKIKARLSAKRFSWKKASKMTLCILKSSKN